MDLSLKEEFLNPGYEAIFECLSELQLHWTRTSASYAVKRKYWKEVLGRIQEAPVCFKIREIRTEISTMWEKCFIGQQEREKFSEFYVGEYTEELLEKHQSVLANLNAYYIEHKEVIEMISKYEEMWKSVLQIQERPNDPERLFKNRGAALLKEGQERKLIARIPEMQKMISKALLQKEREAVLFLIRGQRFSDLIKDHIIVKEDSRKIKRSPEPCLVSESASKKKRLEENVSKGPSSSKSCSPATHSTDGSKVVKNLKWN